MYRLLLKEAPSKKYFKKKGETLSNAFGKFDQCHEETRTERFINLRRRITVPQRQSNPIWIFWKIPENIDELRVLRLKMKTQSNWILLGYCCCRCRVWLLAFIRHY